MDPATATITQLAGALRSRSLSASELLEHHLQRIERLEPVLNAFLTLTTEQARAAAAEADARLHADAGSGPLLGIPIGHKDIYATSGVRTSVGCRALDDHVPDFDAAVVERLAEAGTVSVGKTHCHELASGAMEGYGVTRNPWDVSRAAGGSSSGSAAAVAAGLVVAATASDTGGSVRVPAAFTGTVGFKPTFGRVSRHGMFPISYTLDHPAVLTNCVEDARVLYRALNGPDARDRTTRLYEHESGGSFVALDCVRIGLPNDLLDSGVAPDVSAAIHRAAERFEALGADLVPVEVRDFDHVAPVHSAVWSAEAANRLRGLLVEKRSQMGSIARRRLIGGLLMSAGDYFVAMHRRERIREHMERTFETIDVLLLPAAPFTAHHIDDVAAARSDVSRFNRLANLTGEPAIAFPCGVSDAGLPIGMQLMAGRWREELLLGVAGAYEEATSWTWPRRPQPPTTVNDGRAEAYLEQVSRLPPAGTLPPSLVGRDGDATIDWVRARANGVGLELSEPEVLDLSAQFHRTRMAIDAYHAEVDGPNTTSSLDYLF